MPLVCPLCRQSVQIVGQFSVCPEHGPVTPVSGTGEVAPHYDLFVSYAHKDDQGDHAGDVAALVRWIEQEYQRVTSQPLRVFFDIDEIRSMDDWQQRILTGLRQSRIMLAVLSPSYFASDYCRREWEEYVNHELAHALPGDGIAPIYVLKHPAFDSYNVDLPLDRWLQNLKRRQYVVCHDWWPQGQHALEQAGVQQQLAQVRDQIVTRLDCAERRDRSPHNLPPFNPRFVGRAVELHQIREQLIRSQINAITAVHGLGGIGKSALALVYGHAYGHEYPGGRFWLNCAGLVDLRGAVLQVAAYRGLTFTSAELARPDECFARVKAMFEQGPATLFILDNVDDPALLSPQSRRDSLPHGDQIHVLATSRLLGSALHGVAWLPVDSLTHDDAVALLNRYRPISDAPQDDEWKAAGQIVERLGRHALAIEVVAVYLAEHPTISYRAYYSGLERDGIEIVERAGAINAQEQAELSLHVEQSLGKLLAPTLALLSNAERLAVEYAALLPPDHVPIPWLAALVANDYPEIAAEPASGEEHPRDALFAKLRRLRLVVTGDDPRVGRMHRIMQDVIRADMHKDETKSLKEQLFEHAWHRSAIMEEHWSPDCVWEVEPLSMFVEPCLTHDDRRACLIASVAADSLCRLGSSFKARKLVGRVFEIRERLAQAFAADVTTQRELAISYYQLADLSRAAGDPVEARRMSARALDIQERLAHTFPNDFTSQRCLSIAYSQFGDLARAEGGLVDARRLFTRGLEISERWAHELPDNVLFQRDLSMFCIKLGKLSLSEGDLAEARRLFTRSLQLNEKSAHTLSEDVQPQQDLSVSYIMLAEISRAEGNTLEAQQLLTRSLELLLSVERAMPDDVTIQRTLSYSFCSLAELTRSNGDYVEAQRKHVRGLEIRERLARALPDDVAAQRDLSTSYSLLGDLCFRRGNPVEARRLYLLDLQICEQLSRKLPDDIEVHRDLSVTFERLGYLIAYAGDTVEARRLYGRSLEIRERLARQLPREVQAQQDLAVSFYMLAQLAIQTEKQDEAGAMLLACYQQLERMRAAGMPLDPALARVHQQLAAAFGPHSGSA